MPYKSMQRMSSITEAQLPPHLRGMQGASAFSIAAASINSDIAIYDVGEAIAAGDAVGFDEEAKLIKAGDVEAVGIALESGDIGDSITIRQSGIVGFDHYDFDVGAIVWLAVEALNLTTELPDFALAEFVQQMGVALSSGELLLRLEPGRVVI